MFRLMKNRIKIKINHYQMFKIFQLYHQQLQHKIMVTNIFDSFVFYTSILIIFIVSSSGVWTTIGTNPSEKSSTTQQKKKTAGGSKKKFMAEVQAMSPPPSLSSTDDFPTIGLNELGRRLI